MTPTKEHHAHPASSDTQGAITSRSGLFFPMCFISKGRWWAGPCTCCQTKSPQITPGIATECPHLTRTLPSWNKRHAEGRSDGDGKEEPVAMLKQTPLEWGLDYYTRQGDFFSPPPPPHHVGKLLMTTGMEASWQGTSRNQRQWDRGFVVQKRASKKAHPLGAFVQGLCLTSKSCYTKITGCRYPNKNKSRVLPAHPNDFREELLAAGWQTPQPLSLCVQIWRSSLH